MEDKSVPKSIIKFPSTALVGSVGELAKVLAKGNEVCEEFYFASGLTLLGGIVSKNLTLNLGMSVTPRLYTVLLGETYGAKKSTAMKKIISEFEKIIEDIGNNGLKILYGIGSAEGLMKVLYNDPQTLVCYDELKSFVDKSKVQNSNLLPMVTSLFEGENWDNVTKQSNQNLSVKGAHLSLIGCCTHDTYAAMWSSESIDIGFPNRLFILLGGRKAKIALPQPPDEEILGEIRKKIANQIASLDLNSDKKLVLDLTDEARESWEAYYKNIPETLHGCRLDTIGLRLLPLIAFTMDKPVVDLEVVQIVQSIMDYEYDIRRLTDPVNAENKIARIEEVTRRVLEVHGMLNERDLRRKTHADRVGLWAFKSAIENLVKAGDIQLTIKGKSKLYTLIVHDKEGEGVEAEEPESSPLLSPA